jgi:hypothetical protein
MDHHPREHQPAAHPHPGRLGLLGDLREVGQHPVEGTGALAEAHEVQVLPRDDARQPAEGRGKRLPRLDTRDRGRARRQEGRRGPQGLARQDAGGQQLAEGTVETGEVARRRHGARFAASARPSIVGADSRGRRPAAGA